MKDKLQNGFISTALSVLLVGCSAGGNDGAAAQSAPAAHDRGAACKAAKQTVDKFNPTLGSALTKPGDAGARAGLPEAAAAYAAELRSITAADGELAAAFDGHANAVVRLAALLSSTDRATAEQEVNDDAVGKSYAAIERLCQTHWKPQLGPEAQRAVAAACKTISEIEAKDGATARRLWDSLRTGAVSGSAKAAAQRELVEVWRRMGRVYTDVYFEIPAAAEELREFRSAVFQVGSMRDIAPDLLQKPNGVAEVEKYLSQDALRGYESTVKLFCG